MPTEYDKRVKSVERAVPILDSPVLYLDHTQEIPTWAKERSAAGKLVIIVDDIDSLENRQKAAQAKRDYDNLRKADRLRYNK